MLIREALQALDLSISVAEHDEALARYFVETDTFRTLSRDGADVVSGDKGTGKTALYRILSSRHREIAELSRVEVVAGFNPSGNPCEGNQSRQSVK